MNYNRCTRCDSLRKVMPIFRPGGHTSYVPSLGQALPQAESVCGSCLTDTELLHLIGPIMRFGLSVLSATWTQDNLPDMHVALDILHARFATRNSDSNNTQGRRAALHAIGLDDAGM